MAILSVGPNSLYPTIADAMLAASASDTIQLETGYGNETATVTHDGMIVTGEASSTDVVLDLAIGIATLTLAGAAPINVIDGPDANTIVGNDGDNIITVSSGVDVVNAGAGTDRLIIDYSAAVAAITGTPVNVTDGGTHAVTFTGVESFTISTGSAADTITVGDGVNVVNSGAGNDTITAGNGANTINGGPGNDTIVAGDGGNTINGGDGNDGITTGAGNDIVVAGLGNDTVITGGGADITMVNGGIDTVDSGSGSDRLIVDYSSSITAVNGGVTGGTLAGGYDGNFADVAGTSSVVFHNTENFTVTTGSGNDVIATGDGNDVLDGGAGNDQLNGGGGNDTLLIGLGNDALDGGDGTDAAVFSTTRANYQVNDLGGGVLQTIDLRAGSPDGTDTLVSMESFAFTDGTFDAITILITVPTTTVSTLAFSADTGVSNSDFITSTAAQTISGTLSANLVSGERVEVSLDNGATWTTATAAVGASTFALAGQTLAGSNVLEARVTSLTGSSTAATQAYVLDVTAPGQPTMPALTSGSDSGVQGDGITNVTTLTVTGMAEAGSTVKLYDTDGTTVLGTCVTTGDGTYSITASTLTEGNHTLHVSATDIAGNVSVGSAGVAVTLDTTAPGAPALALAHDTGSSITDAITSDPTITVTAESGATLLYKVDGAVSFSTTAPVFAVDGSADGSHTVLVEQQDAAGNIGAASSLTFTLDTTAPGAPALALANDIGSSITDAITSDPTITVAAESGATLLYKADGAASFSTTTPVFAVDGSADGSHTVLVEQQDAAGNIGAASSLTFTLDTTAPGAPALALANDTGSSITDAITSDPTITVAAESGATLLYKADGATSFSTTAPDFTTDGVHTVAVEQQDAAGNIGAAANLSFTLDTTAPVAPALALAHDTGSSSTDAITSDPTTTVTAESGATLLYKVDGAASFSTTAPAFAVDGSADGSHTVLVEQQDAAGNIGAASSLTSTLDTTAPGAPALALANDTGSSITDAITSDPTITVAAESGATLLYKADGAASFSTTAPVFAVDGSADGSHTVLVEQQDAAGNIGAASGLTFTLDTTAPVAPALALAHDTGSSSVDGITSDPTIDVTAESGATLLYKIDGAASFSTTTPAFAVDGSADGSHTVLVEQQDAAGNIGTASSLTFTLDTTAPVAPALALAHDTGSSSVDGITSDPTIDVTAESGATLLYKIDGAASFSTTTPAFAVDGSADGSHTVLVEQQDAAGNIGTASSLTFTLDTTAPGAPALALAHDTGASTTDAITSDPTITVAAESGATLLYKVDGATSFSATTPAFAVDGSADGSHMVLVEQQDAAGNIGTASSLTFTLDTIAPGAPTLALAHDTGASTTDAITSDPTIDVTAESGATLLYKVDGAAGFSAAAPVFAIDGSSDGSHTVLVEQQDAAGNIGAATSLTFTLDTTAPDAPTLALAHDTGAATTDAITSDPTITVAAESGATLLYKVDGAASFSTTAPVFPVDGSADGSHTVLVEQQDAAGNIGAASGLTFTLDTVAPDAPTLALANDTGSSITDAITSDPTIDVTAESGATLLYKVDGAASFSTTAPVFALDGSNDGSHTVLVEQQDAAGNTGAVSELSFMLDTTAPVAPALALAHDTGSSSMDGITSDPTIDITAESGATLLYKVDGAASFSAAAPVFAIDGSADGSHTVLVEQQDAAGNIGAASSLTFTLDTTAPGAPALALANDTGSSITDAITSDPTITVAAESGATLLYKVDGAASFSTTAPVFAVDGSADGSHTVLVEQQDAAGNIGPASSLTFTLDTTAPGAPALALANDTGSSITDAITSDPTITVAAESGATLLYKVDGAVSFSAAAPVFAVDGSADGSHTVLVEQQDAAGNIGAATSLTFTLDTTAPHVTGLPASLANGTGETMIDFTLTFNEAVTLPLALNNGNSAAYDAAVISALGDSSKLVFDHLVAAGNTPVSFVEVAAFIPHGSVVVDIAGNIADVSHVAASFGHLSDDTLSPPHVPFAFDL